MQKTGESKILDNIYENRYHDTTKRFQGFVKLMVVWKGSVFKLIWHDLLAFILAYSCLSILYRTVLVYDDQMRESFHLICIVSSRFNSIIPITFLTGFYVTQVVTRYWDQFVSLPWPDRLAFKMVGYIPGKEPYHRLLRRTVMRYINLSTVLVFRLVAAKVHARFPDNESMIKAGLLLPHEAARLQDVVDSTNHETTWTPILWAVNLLQTERVAGRITVEAPIFSNLIGAFDYIDTCNRRIFNHGWVNFPLAYTQVATLSVYSYLFSSLFAHQFLQPSPENLDRDVFPTLNITFATTDPFNRHSPDIYIPIFTILEFIGYMGWIKVAETLLNPWGDDDEDFQINYLIDRNFKVSYLIVDEAMVDLPMEEDPFEAAGVPVPSELPYNNDDQHDKKSKITLHEVTSFDDNKKRPFSNLRKAVMLPVRRLRNRRAHRCQSTRSRLRSLNENRKPVVNHSKKLKTSKRVHRISEMSIAMDDKSLHRLEDAVIAMTTLPVSLTMTSEQNGGPHLTLANTNANRDMYANGHTINKNPRNGILNNSKVKFTSRNLTEDDMGIEFHV